MTTQEDFDKYLLSHVTRIIKVDNTETELIIDYAKVPKEPRQWSFKGDKHITFKGFKGENLYFYEPIADKCTFEQCENCEIFILYKNNDKVRDIVLNGCVFLYCYDANDCDDLSIYNGDHVQCRCMNLKYVDNIINYSEITVYKQSRNITCDMLKNILYTCNITISGGTCEINLSVLYKYFMQIKFKASYCQKVRVVCDDKQLVNARDWSKMQI